MRAAAWAALAAAAAAGCGGGGDGRFPVSGAVRWHGAAVAAGQILFEPDPARGGRGPAGVAEIAAGRYRTDPEFGAAGGPHLARVRLCDGVGRGPMQPFGKLIAPEFTVPVDLPAAPATLDFDLPPPGP